MRPGASVKVDVPAGPAVNAQRSFSSGLYECLLITGTDGDISVDGVPISRYQWVTVAVEEHTVFQSAGAAAGVVLIRKLER